MFERFTDRARKVMALANHEALRLNHEYIGTEHILLGLVQEGAGVGANVLKNLGVDLPKLRREVEKLVKLGPEEVAEGKLPQTPRAKRVIEYAIEESRALGHNYVGTEHMLLGLLREVDGVAAQVLVNLGVGLQDVRGEVLMLLGRGREVDEPTPNVAPATKVLEDDEVGKLALELLAQLTARKDAAVGRADYESAAEYRDLSIGAECVVRGLSALIQRQTKPDDSAPPTT